MTSGATHPFWWCNIQIYMEHLQLDVLEAKASQLCAADWSGMTFTLQKSGYQAKLWDMRAAAPSMHALSWVWRSSTYCYASMELPMMRLWGHTEKSPLALCATSRVATSPRPSNMQLAYMGQNLALDRMMSVLASSVPLAPWHFSVAVLTAVASASLVGGKVGPCSGTYICNLERPCATSPRPCSRGAR